MSGPGRPAIKRFLSRMRSGSRRRFAERVGPFAFVIGLLDKGRPPPDVETNPRGVRAEPGLHAHMEI